MKRKVKSDKDIAETNLIHWINGCMAHYNQKSKFHFIVIRFHEKSNSTKGKK